MTEKQLADKLREMYDNAPEGKQVVNIHLFGIIYADEIVGKRYSINNIVRGAELPESYKAEINKAINLSEYVIVK
ncbi:MAG: hypothetical protein M0Q94_16110 [Candidatus Cloacimonetes bacterium]|nr:hypothetical protein [Candidatus Cloacimonadota bacterium]